MVATGGIKYQYLAGICVNIISFSYGAFCGWPSASILELQAPDSPLQSGPLSNEMAGWVASIFCIGGIVGTLLAAWSADIIGRKRCLLLLVIPSLVSWLSIPFVRNGMELCLSRFLGGLVGGGAFAVIPTYVTELADNNMRGILGTFLVLSCNMGLLFAFVLGHFFSYATVAYIVSVFTLIFLATFVFLPETPQHLFKQKKFEEAEYALRYYRNIRKASTKELSVALQDELKKLREIENIEMVPKETNADSRLTWRDFSNRRARKILFISLGLMALNQFCGCFAMLNYTATIFAQAGSSLRPTAAAIVVGSIQVVGTYMSTLLVERAGRKILLFISSLGTSIGLSCLGTYNYLTHLGYETGDYAWIPVASFSFTIFIANWGVLTLPFLVFAEISPPKIRRCLNMFCMTMLWLFAFLMIKFLPTLTETLGIHGAMYLFSCCSFVGALFVLLCVPETKGKSIENILAHL